MSCVKMHGFSLEILQSDYKLFTRRVDNLDENDTLTDPIQIVFLIRYC